MNKTEKQSLTLILIKQHRVTNYEMNKHHRITNFDVNRQHRVTNFEINEAALSR
jgi:hypothetical protein